MDTQKHSEHYTAELKRLEATYPILEGKYPVADIKAQMQSLMEKCRTAQSICDRYMEKHIEGKCDMQSLSRVCETSGACIQRFNTLQKHYNDNGYKVLAYRDRYTATPYRVEVYAPKGDGYLVAG